MTWIEWESQEHVDRYLAKEDSKAFHDVVAAAQAHPTKGDLTVFAFMESADTKEELYTSPVTEIAVCKLHPDFNAEEFENRFDSFRDSHSNNKGQWGRLAGTNGGQYVVVLPWQSVEVSFRCIIKVIHRSLCCSQYH